MGRILCILCIVSLVLAPNILASDPSSSTHIYVIEYKKPVSGSGDTATLDVVFYTKIEPGQAELFLRIELKRLLKLMTPRLDILATFWYSPGDRSTERIILFPDGSNHLLYDVKRGKILTSIQAWGSSVPTPPPRKK